MITPQQRQNIIQTLGSNHLLEIQQHLTDREIFGRGDEPYSTESIRRILKGKYENYRVEKEIVNLWENRLFELEEEEARKQRLLSASQEYNSNL